MEPRLTLSETLEQWSQIECDLAESNRRRQLQNLSLSLALMGIDPGKDPGIGFQRIKRGNA